MRARGLRWTVVLTESLGPQTLFRLRGLEGAVHGTDLDILHPFEPVEPMVHDLCPDRAAPLTNWLVYHQAFLLEQALGPDAMLAVQPGRLRLEPYQLVPVLRAIRMSRVRLLLADGVGLGKTVQAGLIVTELIATSSPPPRRTTATIDHSLPVRTARSIARRRPAARFVATATARMSSGV